MLLGTRSRRGHVCASRDVQDPTLEMHVQAAGTHVRQENEKILWGVLLVRSWVDSIWQKQKPILLFFLRGSLVSLLNAN